MKKTSTRTQKQIRRTEQWLDVRYSFSVLKTREDLLYYEGALKAVELLGYKWKRDKNGKHTIFKH